jgi:hypothetical protein
MKLEIHVLFWDSQKNVAGFFKSFTQCNKCIDQL